MSDQPKKYWQNLLTDSKSSEISEFSELLPLDDNKPISSDSRRDFLKKFGFGVSWIAFLSSCEIPVRKAIPYLIRPEEITPGIANWYASTFSKGGDCNSILVKTREGRPVKIEGNPSSPLSKGGVTAQTQASVLDLYDSARLIFPMKNGKQTTWEEIDKEIIEKLNTIKLKGGN